jgi:hypothetical protein
LIRSIDMKPDHRSRLARSFTSFAVVIMLLGGAACSSETSPMPNDASMSKSDADASQPDDTLSLDVAPEDTALDVAFEDTGTDVVMPLDVVTERDVQIAPDADARVSTDVRDVLSPPDVPTDMPVATAAHANCAMATRLAGTSRLMGENLSLARGTPASANCGAGDRLFYTITVPAASSIVITVTPTGAPAWNPTIRVLDACMETSPFCGRFADYTGTGAPERMRFVNQYSSGATGMPIARDMIIAIGANGTAMGTFDLEVRVDPPAPNATCAGALPLPIDGSAITADIGNGQATGTLCAGGLTGVPALYYQATVPPGSELTATMTPTGTPAFGAELFSYTGCSPTCFTRVHTGDDGAAESIVVANNGTTPQVFTIGASSNASLPLGTFSLTGLVAPQFYALSSFSASCESVPSVGTYMSPNRVTAAQVLPIPFTLFGAAVGAFALSTNGFMQLLPMADGTLDATPLNRAIPLPEAPNGIVAPFWDALAPRATFGSSLRAGVLGTAPNRRFVVEWNDWGLVEDPTARLRFQAKLFETTRVIELHYCSLAMGTMTEPYQGRRATVGIENLTGTRAVLLGANVRRVVMNGGAFRLTPR